MKPSSVAMPPSSKIEITPSSSVAMMPSSVETPPITPSPSLAMPPSTTIPNPVSASITASLPMFPGPTPTPTPLSPSCFNDSMLCPSDRDTRSYAFTTLNNGLDVVLISDPETDLSGASMDVAAGSFDDPSDYPGLAHFCEHMLFLGTKKYPVKNQYSDFIHTHNGHDNAYTSYQETNYYFSVDAGFIEHTLDMFAQFFTSPLFNKDSVDSELNAVNQEHEKNLLNDLWKLHQLLKHVSNPDHPFSQFSTGNFDTLNKSDVRERLLEYYHARYSASTVSWMVLGCASVGDHKKNPPPSFNHFPP